MGMNNKQRRAAKQKARAQRAKPQPSGRGSSETSGPSPFYRVATGEPGVDQFVFGSPSREALQRDHANLTLKRMIFTASAGVRKLPDSWIHGQILEPGTEGLGDPRIFDEQMTLRFMAVLASLWENGWQPLDVVHVVRRVEARLAQLAAAVITEQARRTDAEERAPQEWLDQLRAVADEVASSGLNRLVSISPDDPSSPGTWLVADAQQRVGIRSIDAWRDIIVLAGLLDDQRPFEPLMPPPSKWGAHAARRRVVEEGSDHAKLLNRIRALLAKAEATEYAAEAEAFTAKAQDMMTRHAIDAALLDAGDERPIDVHAKRVHLANPYAASKVQLLAQVGSANRVKTIFTDRLGIATIVGTPVDVDQVEMLFTSLLIQATHAMTEAGAAKRAGSQARSASFRRSFLMAYAVRIGERLTEADQAATKSYGQELVPVLERQRAAVEDEFDRLFPHTRQGNTSSFDARGWNAGREAAEKAVFTAGRISA